MRRKIVAILLCAVMQFAPRTAWCQTFSETHPGCTTITPPIVENFDGYGIGLHILPDCWDYFANFDNELYMPQIVSAPVANGIGALMISSGPNYTQNHYTLLMSPPISAGMQTMIFQTSIRSNLAGAFLVVGICDTVSSVYDNYGFVPLDTIIIATENAWEQISIDFTDRAENLSTLTQHHCRLAFYMLQSSQPSYPCHIYMDHMEGHICTVSDLSFSGVTDQSVTVSWNSVHSDNATLTLRTSSGELVETRVSVSSSQTFTGLQPQTTYTASVIPNCNYPGTTGDSIVGLITTLPDVTALPVCSSFEPPYSLYGWHVAASCVGFPRINTNATQQGNYSLDLASNNYIVSNGNYSLVGLPRIIGSGSASRAVLDFWVYIQSNSISLEIGTIDLQSADVGSSFVSSSTHEYSGGWQHIVQTVTMPWGLTSYKVPALRAIASAGYSTPQHVYIDNLRYDTVGIYGNSTLNVTSSSADLIWSSIGGDSVTVDLVSNDDTRHLVFFDNEDLAALTGLSAGVTYNYTITLYTGGRVTCSALEGSFTTSYSTLQADYCAGSASHSTYSTGPTVFWKLPYLDHTSYDGLSIALSINTNNYSYLEVGLMSDYYDDNTFHTIGTFNGSYSNRQVIPLQGYESYGHYLAIRMRSSYNDLYATATIEDIRLSYGQLAYNPNVSITDTSVIIYPIVADGVVDSIVYTYWPSQGGEDTLTFTVPLHTSDTITGLQPLTQYTITLQPKSNMSVNHCGLVRRNFTTSPEAIYADYCVSTSSYSTSYTYPQVFLKLPFIADDNYNNLSVGFDLELSGYAQVEVDLMTDYYDESTCYSLMYYTNSGHFNISLQGHEIHGRYLAVRLKSLRSNYTASAMLTNFRLSHGQLDNNIGILSSDTSTIVNPSVSLGQVDSIHYVFWPVSGGDTSSFTIPLHTSDTIVGLSPSTEYQIQLYPISNLSQYHCGAYSKTFTTSPPALRADQCIDNLSYNTSSTGAIVFWKMPYLNESSYDNLSLFFEISSNNYCILDVGFLTDYYNDNTFHLISTITGSNDGSIRNISLQGQETCGRYLALRLRTSNYRYSAYVSLQRVRLSFGQLSPNPTIICTDTSAVVYPQLLSGVVDSIRFSYWPMTGGDTVGFVAARQDSDTIFGLTGSTVYGFSMEPISNLSLYNCGSFTKNFKTTPSGVVPDYCPPDTTLAVSYGNTALYVLPYLNVDNYNNLSVSFQQNATNPSTILEVGLLSNYYNPETFYNVQRYNGAFTTRQTVNLQGQEGHGAYLAFRLRSMNSNIAVNCDLSQIHIGYNHITSCDIVPMANTLIVKTVASIQTDSTRFRYWPTDGGGDTLEITTARASLTCYDTIPSCLSGTEYTVEVILIDNASINHCASQVKQVTTLERDIVDGWCLSETMTWSLNGTNTYYLPHAIDGLENLVLSMDVRHTNRFHNCMIQVGVIHSFTYNFVPLDTIYTTYHTLNYGINLSQRMAAKASIITPYHRRLAFRIITGTTGNVIVSRLLLSHSEPTDLRVHNITDTSSLVRLNILTANGETALPAIVKLVRGNDTTTTIVTPSTATFAIDTLSPDTHYWILVASDEPGATDEECRWTKIDFRTLPESYLIPHCDHFEDYLTIGDIESLNYQNMPTGWSVVEGNSSTSTVHQAGERGLLLSSLYSYGSSRPSIAVSPYISTPLSQLNIIISGYMSSNGCTAQIGAISDPDDASTFSVIQTLNTVTSWTIQTVSLQDYTGDAHYLAIRFTSSQTSERFFYIDNIRISSCALPLASVSNVTDSSVTVGWEGNYEGMYISWGSDLNNLDTVFVIGNQMNLMGLNAMTTYYFYLWPQCNGIADNCYNSYAYQHTEAMSSALPYCQSFSNSATPEGWMIKGTGSFVPSTFDGYCLQLGARRNNPGIALLPPLSLLELEEDSIYLNFWLLKTASGSLQVGVVSDVNDTTTFTSLTTVAIGASSSWQSMIVALPLSGIGSGRLAFRYTNTYNSTYYLCIDNVCLERCLATGVRVTAITQTEITVEWTSRGSDNLTVEFTSSDGVHSGSYSSSTSPFTVSGLYPGTDYTFTFSTSCGSEGVIYPYNGGGSGGGDGTDGHNRGIGSISGPTQNTASEYNQYGCRTLPPDMSDLPYCENFDTGNLLPEGWISQGGVSVMSSSFPAHSGNRAILFSSSNATLVMPPVNNVSQLNLAFYAFSTDITSSRLSVGIVVNPYDLSSFTPVDTIIITGRTVYRRYFADLSSYTGMGHYIAFRCLDSYNAVLDDMVLWAEGQTPECNITDTTLDTLSVPYCEQFSGDTTLYDWVELTHVSDSYPQISSGYYQMYAGYNSPHMVALPVLPEGDSLGGYNFQFQMMCGVNYTYQWLDLGYLTTENDPSSFVQITTCRGYNSTSWYTYSGTITNNVPANRLVLRARMSTSRYALFSIDKFMLYRYPKPTVTTHFYSYDSIALTWPSVSGNSHYFFEIGQGDYEVGTGTIVASDSCSVTFDSLLPATYYRCYILDTAGRYYCDNYFISFTTPPAQEIPYCNTSSGSYNIPQGNVVCLFQPDSGNINDLTVTIELKGSYTATLEVGVCTEWNNGSTFTPVATLHPSSTSDFYSFDVSMSEYTGEGKFLALRSTYGSIIYRVVRVDRLPRPTIIPISSHSVKLVTTGFVHPYYAELTTNNAQLTGETYHITQAVDTLEGLQPGTMYMLFIREDSSEASCASYYKSVQTFYEQIIPVCYRTTNTIPSGWSQQIGKFHSRWIVLGNGQPTWVEVVHNNQLVAGLATKDGNDYTFYPLDTLEAPLTGYAIDQFCLDSLVADMTVREGFLYFENPSFMNASAWVNSVRSVILRRSRIPELHAVAVSSSSVNVSGSGGECWVELRPAGGNLGSGSIYHYRGNTLVFDSLTQNTNYDVYFREDSIADCSWPITVTTPREIEMPYCDLNNSTFPQGWNISGGHYVTLPYLLDSIGEVKISFTLSGGTVVVGVMNSLYDTLSFVPVDTLSANEWTYMATGFDNYFGTGRYITFRFASEVTEPILYSSFLRKVRLQRCVTPAVSAAGSDSVCFVMPVGRYGDPNCYMKIAKTGQLDTIHITQDTTYLGGLTSNTAYTFSPMCDSTGGACGGVSTIYTSNWLRPTVCLNSPSYSSTSWDGGYYYNAELPQVIGGVGGLYLSCNLYTTTYSKTVELQTFSGNSWETVHSVYVDSYNSTTFQCHIPSSYTGDRLRFRVYCSYSGRASNFTISNFVLGRGSGISAITSIGPGEIIVQSMHDPEGLLLFHSSESDTVVPFTSNPMTVSGLLEGTSYTVYSIGDSNDAYCNGSAVTTGISVELPYCENSQYSISNDGQIIQLVAPHIDDMQRVRVQMAIKSDAPNSGIIVGTKHYTTASNYEIVPIDTLLCSRIGAWEVFDVDFGNWTDGGRIICLKSVGFPVYVKNIIIDTLIPPAITNVFLSRWNEAYVCMNPSPGDSTWLVLKRSGGGNPDLVLHVPIDTVIISELDAQTTYTVKTYTDTAISTCFGPMSFSTSTEPPVVPWCVEIPNYPAYTMFSAYSTTSADRRIINVNSPRYNGYQSLMMSCAPGYWNYMCLPDFGIGQPGHVSTMQELALSVTTYAGDANSRLVVATLPRYANSTSDIDPLSLMTVVDTICPNRASVWERHIIHFDNLPQDSSQKIIILLCQANSNTNTYYIGDFQVASCGVHDLVMEDIDESSVTLSWKQVGTPNVTIDVDNQTQGTTYQIIPSGTSVNGMVTYTVEGLDSLTNYLIRLNSNCPDPGCDVSYSDSIAVFTPVGGGNCLDATNLHAQFSHCYYGTYENPYQQEGIVNRGAASALSRHTIHFDTTERDPRTGGLLRTIPEGASASIRVGNWDHNNINPEAEAISYSVYVDTLAFDLLILRYAAVLQDIMHDPIDQPRFRLQVLDQDMNVIDEECAAADFIANHNLGWNIASDFVLWKDWTSVGVDLAPYAGQMVNIRLTTYDCNEGSHYGYAYFTVDCFRKNIVAQNCGDYDQNTFTAPAGFNYSWYTSSNPVPFSQERSITINSGETTYLCDISFLDNPNCYFTTSIYSGMRFPRAAFDSVVTLKNCAFDVNFINHSFVTSDGITPLPGESTEGAFWDFGNGTTSTSYNGHCVYDEPGTYQVTLVSYIGGGVCTDTIVKSITLALPISNPHITGPTERCATFTIPDTLRLHNAQSWTSWEDSILIVSPLTDTTYTVDITDINGCSRTLTHTIHVHPRYSLSFYDSVCEGESYSFIDTAFIAESSLSYSYTIVDTFGCDSMVTLYLTVNHSTEGVDIQTHCDTYTWIDGNAYNSSNNTATFTLQGANVGGCDSTVSLNLTILNSVTGTDEQTACDSYEWIDGQTYTASNSSAQYTLSSAEGCDSVVTLHLTIRRNSTGIDVHTACDSFTWINDSTYTTGNTTATYTLTDANIAGCDSIVTLNLTLYNSVTGIDGQMVCDSFTWIDGQTYTTSNNTASYLLSGASVHGCDSTSYLDLIILHSTFGDTNATACDSMLWHGLMLYDTGDTLWHELNAAGCDSSITLHLTVYNSTEGDTAASVCDSFVWYGVTYTSSTEDAEHLFLNSLGCDSTVTLHLTILTTTTSAIHEETYENDLPHLFHGQTFNGDTMGAVIVIPNAAGCDSLINYSLTVHWNDRTNVDSTVCVNQLPMEWNGVTFATAGTQTATLVNSANADSVVSMTLHVNPVYHDTIDISICDNQQYTFEGTVYSDAGTYSRPLQTNAGCDSLRVLHLVVIPTSTGDTTAVSCDSLIWWNTVYFSSTETPSHVYVNTYGCDSTVTLHLTVNYSTAGDTSAVVCDSIHWNGVTYSETAVSTHLHANAAGCDSAVTLHLTVNHSTAGIDVQSHCDTYMWIDGQTYTESNTTATHTLTGSNGCDSTVTLHLTINHPMHNSVSETACETYTWNDTLYTVSGDYTHSHPDANGCTQIDTLRLIINTPIHSATNETACETYTWNSIAYRVSGDYTYSYPDTNGCTQVDTLHLTVNYNSSGIVDTTVCNTIIWHGTEYTESTNSPTHTSTNAAGCDSVTTLHLTVNQCSLTTLTVCDRYIWNGTVYTASGTYIHGNDTLILMVNYSSMGVDTMVTACDNFIWHDASYSISGNYHDTLQNTVSCDSVLTLHLIILPSTVGDTSSVACDIFTWHGLVLDNTVDTTWTTVNGHGCDSVVTLHLTINNSTSETDVQVACDSYTWIDGNVYYESVNGAQLTTINSAGCDSVVTLILTINHSSTGVDPQEHCNSYTWIDGHTYTASNNTAQYTTVNSVGCDSTVTLNLVILHSTDTTIHEDVLENNLPHLFHGQTFSDDTMGAIVVIPNAAGCDSIISYSLTVFRNGHSNADSTVCADQLPLEWNGVIFSAAGTQSITFTNAYGADSVVSMILHVNPVYHDTVDLSICDNQQYAFEGIMYGSVDTGLHVHQMQTIAGCDSLRVLHLDVRSSSSGVFMATVCDSIDWHNHTYIISGDYLDTLTNIAGCDSVVMMHLTVKYSSLMDTSAMVCDSFVWRDNNTYTGNVVIRYPLPIVNSQGCDSVVRLDLTVNHSSIGDTSAIACDSYLWHGKVYSVSGDYLDTMVNAVGCDSLLTLNLSIHSSTTSVEDTSVCYSFFWHGTEYTESTNTPTYTTTNAYGCDSTVTLHLTVNLTVFVDTVIVACDSLLWYGTTLYHDIDTIWNNPNATGCDSTVALHLTVNNSSVGTDIQTACDSYQWIDGQTYTESTFNASLSIPNSSGCDSVLTLQLTLYHSVDTIVYDTMCYNSTYIWNDYYITGTELYDMEEFMLRDTLNTSVGCDSAVTIYLTKVAMPRILLEASRVCHLMQYRVEASVTAPLTPGGEPQTLSYLVWSSDPVDTLLDGHEYDNPIYVRPYDSTSYLLIADYNESTLCPTPGRIVLRPYTVPQAVIKVNPEHLSYNEHDFIAYDISDQDEAERAWYIDWQRQSEIGRTLFGHSDFEADSVVVALELSNGLCSDTAVQVLPVRQIALFAPNIFAPGAADNNHFDIITHGVLSGELFIYTREGLFVYHASDYTTGWDGRKADGTACSQGGYVWKLVYRDLDRPDNEKVEVGTVLLIR